VKGESYRDQEDLIAAKSISRPLQIPVNEGNHPVMGGQRPRAYNYEAVVTGIHSRCNRKPPLGELVLASRGREVKRVRLNRLRKYQRGDIGEAEWSSRFMAMNLLA
jgi:hypothetical protein